jgi:5-methylcytosine-specific restriction enzyme subunit McrC
MPSSTNESGGVLVRNIYNMLAYAYHALWHKDYADIESENFDYVHDMFAAILAKGIAGQLKRGLHREYIEQEGILSSLKGKIAITESIGLKIKRDNRLACRYDDLSENVYMNRILKSTALMLAQSEEVKPENRKALKKSLHCLPEIKEIDPSAIDWRILNYNRNNAAYRMLMNVCWLSLQSLLPSKNPGNQKLAVFNDDQAFSKLYEKFLLEYFKKHFSQYNPASRQIKWDSEGSTEYLPQMYSDVMLVSKRKKLVIEAKYYSQMMQTYRDAVTVRSAHLYQIYAYVQNENKGNADQVSGALLYAKTGESIAPDNEYVLGGNRFAVKTLDLNTPFNEIDRQLRALVSDWEKTDVETGKSWLPTFS